MQERKFKDKKEARTFFKKILKNLSQERKQKGQEVIFDIISTKSEQFNFVLSFASMQEEINLWELNNFIAKKKKLLLPKVEGQRLGIYHVNDLTKMKKNNSYDILEPDSQLCEKINISDIDLVLVPALAFDQYNYRLGRGGGYYDRLLSTIKCENIGVGFKEQLVEEVPHDVLDIKVDEILLV